MNENTPAPAPAVELPYEEIQTRFCSNSRKGRTSVPGRMGGRLVKTVEEAWPLFQKAGGPILDIGCGDGLGMEHFLALGAHTVKGIEVSQARVDVAKSFGLDVFQGTAEERLSTIPTKSHEIFCSHTIEHVKDRALVLREIGRIAKAVIWLSFPVERRGRSGNKAHFSPVQSSAALKKQFIEVADDKWDILRLEERINLEPEGILVLRRR